MTHESPKDAVNLVVDNGPPEDEVEGNEPVESITLTLTPAAEPRLRIRKGGVEIPKTCSLLDLLGFLDESCVLEALKLPPHRTSHAPPLPPRTLLLSKMEFPDDVHYILTGWMPPARYPFVVRSERATTTHSVPLPVIVYRAHWQAADRKLKALSLTLAPGFPADAPADTQLATTLYRYPFSNVYGEYGGVMEAACWPTIGNEALALSEIPQKGVHSFLSIPNNAHLYGVGTTHNAPHRGYRELLEAIEHEGLAREWLIPAQINVAGLHNQRRKKGVV